MLNGQINTVGALLLGKFQENFFDHSKAFTSEELIIELKKIFREIILAEIVGLILFHISLAKNEKSTSNFFANTDLFIDEFERLGANANKMRIENALKNEIFKKSVYNPPPSHYLKKKLP